MTEQRTMSTSVTTPACIGVVMDGNRRWARARNVSTIEGHTEGFKKLKEVVEWCKEDGVSHVVAYAFSTENWRRAEEEVGGLMNLMRHVLQHELAELRTHDVAVHVVGALDRFPEDLQQAIAELHATNPKDATRHLWSCASYGGRAEIVAAMQTLLAKGVDDVDEQGFAQAVWTAGMPDPDLIVRTGGQRRLSNFLTWQSVYSELFFLDTLWPDLTRTEWDTMLAEYCARKRNFGA